MRLKTLASFALDGKLDLLSKLTRETNSFYRVCFIAAAADAGILRLLNKRTLHLQQLAVELNTPDSGLDALEAWLDVGVSLGELRRSPEGYSLAGALSRALALPQNDSMLAMFEEAAHLHHALICNSLARTGQRRTFLLSDQDGTVVARSSRILEPLVCEAIDQIMAPRQKLRLLEVGCGSGVYIRYCAQRNLSLTAVGVELQPDVANMARQNIAEWGLADRVNIEDGDIRNRLPESEFDLATLHNNIYYFPVDERTSLLSHIRKSLNPGGKILITTACPNGGPITEVLNLWGTITEGADRLPSPGEMIKHLEEAGFSNAQKHNLAPTGSYWAFSATNPAC